MKKIFFAVVFVFSIVLSHHAGAQEATIISVPEKPGDKHTTECINSNVLKNFERRFQHINDAVWTKTNDGAYIASFIKDSVRTMVAYNKRGIWHHTIRSADKKLLPYHLQMEIKSNYHNYFINSVQEVNLAEQTVYFIFLAGKTDFRIIKMREDETSEVQSFTRW